MFNANRIETIRKNIQNSTILSDHEKADWLNLLELMNDKQLGELEDILAAESANPAVAQAASSQGTLAQSQAQPKADKPVPQLSHIANMPADVTLKRSAPVAAPVQQAAPQPRPKPKPAPVAPPVPQPRPVPQPARVQPTPAPVIPKSNPPKTNFTPLPVRPTPSPSLGDIAPKPVIQRVPAPAPAAQPAPIPVPQPQFTQPAEPVPTQGQATLTVQDFSELQNLNLQTLRNFNYQSISSVIKTAIAEHGYFPVLQLIESSDLYKGYIEAGKERLGVRSPSGAEIRAGFTQEEFEYVADLLLNMRFNRL